MAVQEVLQFGNPLLRKVAVEVTDVMAESARRVMRDLEDTLTDLQQIHGMGGGLAAPQIGSSTRTVHISARGRSLQLINPVIIERSEEIFEVWDFCFSADAAFLAPVQRHRRISVEWHDQDDRPQTEVFDGYFSELLQHEIDHLDGVLFVDHITRPEAITMAREWDPANATP